MENKSPLRYFFSPQSVAIIGAKEEPGSVGRTLMVNLASFAGNLFPVNPKHKSVLGHTCYSSVLEIRKSIDLAIIAVPAQRVLEALESCVRAKIPSAIIISAGFKESGREGELLEKNVVTIVKESKIRLIGPNCLGVMNPHTGFNGSFSSSLPLPGSLAFISQSGAMCTAVLDWSLSEEIGFSSFASIGSMADVGWADLIEYFGSDPTTKAILMYMETIKEPERFLKVARSIAPQKPLIVIKPGRTQEAARAAASHTGALVGSDAVFDAVCERAGILRVETMNELFDMAEVLTRQPYPQGPRFAIVTNAGGPGVLATDAVVRCGATMATLSSKTIGRLNSFLPKAWSNGNPVDILGDADPKRYEESINEVIEDDSVDGLLVILTPQEMTNPLQCAQSLEHFSHYSSKPVFASWMGGESVKSGKKALHKSGIPCFSYPEEAVWSFSVLWKHSKALQQMGIKGEPSKSTKKDTAGSIIEGAGKEGRELLSEVESKEILSSYGLPVVTTFCAATQEEALTAAESIGYPVVMKVHSHTVVHKSEVGGVALNLHNPGDIKKAFSSIKQGVIQALGHKAFLGVSIQKMISMQGIELIIGSSRDPQFGPVVLFGAGGRYVEQIADQTLGLPPLNSISARKMIEKTQASKALLFELGEDSVKQIDQMLISFSHMVLDLPRIKECDINPVLASSEGILCLDARIVLCV